MTFTRYLATGVSALALTAMTAISTSATARQIHYPFKMGVHFKVARQKGPLEAPYVAPDAAKSGTWADVGNLPFANGAWAPLLLTDGTVILEDFCTVPTQWYKLTPDKKGKYEDGKWSKIATMPSGYAPLFFASQTLSDGRLIVNGGEYNAASNGNCGSGAWTTKGALYDPAKDSWTAVSPPTGWGNIGDAQSVILPDGSYMLADCCNNLQAIATISGTTVTWTKTGSGKADENDEEGWTLLPSGNVLVVDAWLGVAHTQSNTEIYDTSAGTWSAGPLTVNQLVDPGSHELGPAVLRPDGNVVYFGANQAGPINVYNEAANTWVAAPSFPVIGGKQYDVADGPAALLPDGNVIVDASPGVFNNPSHFFEFSITSKGVMKLTQVNDPKQAPGTSSFEGAFLDLPTGQVLWTDSQTTPNEVATYTPTGSPKAAWLPNITSVSASLSVGSKKNAISGKNFNGFSFGASYGDDAQQATNFPIVRITNTGTGDVCFGRSYNFSTMGVFNTGKMNAVFDIPASCETGASKLQVIVNGIASKGVAVTLS
jgi:hypothetical protein